MHSIGFRVRFPFKFGLLVVTCVSEVAEIFMTFMPLDVACFYFTACLRFEIRVCQKICTPESVDFF